ncbi:MAG: hypothetical protein R2939_22340 [Kofleriaceae bacterium]
MTLALGAVRDGDDGARLVDLNVGKSRMGAGDCVFPLSFDGRTGVFTVSGDPVPAAQRRDEVRAEQASKRAEAKGAADTVVELAIRGALGGQADDAELRAAVKRSRPAVLAAIRAPAEPPVPSSRFWRKTWGYGRQAGGSGPATRPARRTSRSSSGGVVTADRPTTARRRRPPPRPYRSRAGWR